MCALGVPLSIQRPALPLSSFYQESVSLGCYWIKLQNWISLTLVVHLVEWQTRRCNTGHVSVSGPPGACWITIFKYQQPLDRNINLGSDRWSPTTLMAAGWSLRICTWSFSRPWGADESHFHSRLPDLFITLSMFLEALQLRKRAVMGEWWVSAGNWRFRRCLQTKFPIHRSGSSNPSNAHLAYQAA